MGSERMSQANLPLPTDIYTGGTDYLCLNALIRPAALALLPVILGLTDTILSSMVMLSSPGCARCHRPITFAVKSSLFQDKTFVATSEVGVCPFDARANSRLFLPIVVLRKSKSSDHPGRNWGQVVSRPLCLTQEISQDDTLVWFMVSATLAAMAVYDANKKVSSRAESPEQQRYPPSPPFGSSLWSSRSPWSLLALVSCLIL